MLAPPRVPLEVRFWSKVDRRGDGECWPWLRSTFDNGYGQFTIRPEESGFASVRNVRAHRVAFFLVHGRWPDPFALHGCDFRLCCNAVNPEHVHEGTHQDNMDEMWQRGRGDVGHVPVIGRGQAHPRARLSDEQAAQVRALRGQVSQHKMAAMFGVSRGVISHILSGRSYVGSVSPGHAQLPGTGRA